MAQIVDNVEERIEQIRDLLAAIGERHIGISAFCDSRLEGCVELLDGKISLYGKPDLVIKELRLLLETLDETRIDFEQAWEALKRGEISVRQYFTLKGRYEYWLKQLIKKERWARQEISNLQIDLGRIIASEPCNCEG